MFQVSMWLCCLSLNMNIFLSFMISHTRNPSKFFHNHRLRRQTWKWLSLHFEIVRVGSPWSQFVHRKSIVILSQIVEEKEHVSKRCTVLYWSSLHRGYRDGPSNPLFNILSQVKILPLSIGQIKIIIFGLNFEVQILCQIGSQGSLFCIIARI